MLSSAEIASQGASLPPAEEEDVVDVREELWFEVVPYHRVLSDLRFWNTSPPGSSESTVFWYILIWKYDSSGEKNVRGN